MNQPDPVVAEIRATRERLLRESQNDLRQYAKDAHETAKKLGFRALTSDEFKARQQRKPDKLSRG